MEKKEQVVMEAVIVVALLSIVMALCMGCAVKPHQPPVTHTAPAPLAPALPRKGVVRAVPIAAITPPPPVKARPKNSRKEVEVLAEGGRTIFFEPGKKYRLECPEFGALTVKFPAEERVQAINAGNSGEWMIQQSSMGIGTQIAVLAIRRAPFAASSELHVITDAEVYQFLLIPKANGVSVGQTSLITIINPNTEARLAARREERLHAMEQEQRAREIRAPQLDAAQVRVYQIGGDRVPWRPVSVVGDHRHTVIQLPPATGADQPTLTVIEYGKEMRVNTRTLPEKNGLGPQIVIDQPITEARLIGTGGTVSIVGGYK